MPRRDPWNVGGRILPVVAAAFVLVWGAASLPTEAPSAGPGAAGTDPPRSLL